MSGTEVKDNDEARVMPMDKLKVQFLESWPGLELVVLAVVQKG